MKTIQFLGVVLLTLMSVCLSGCSDDNDEVKEIYPIRFIEKSHEVRLFQLESISFVDGGGDYAVSVADEEILSATINANTKNLSINGKKKGTTTVTIRDNKANEEVTLTIKVVDSYLGFVNRNSNISFFPLESDLFLVNDEQKSFYLFKQERGGSLPVEAPILTGQYETTVADDGLYLKLTFTNDKEEEETHTYNITDSDQEVFSAMNKYLNSNWPKTSNDLTRSVGPRIYRLDMKEVDTEYNAQWTLDLMKMPKGILE